MQYSFCKYGVQHRFRMLVLRGESMSGKSSFANSLFGKENTLLVNCQRLQSELPSLRDFDESKHCCIVFDESVHMQVFNNKNLFQTKENIVARPEQVCGDRVSCTCSVQNCDTVAIAQSVH